MTVPDGAFSILSRSQVALALNVSETVVKGWLQRDLIPYFQVGGKGKRFVRSEDLDRFARDIGLSIDWERVI